MNGMSYLILLKVFSSNKNNHQKNLIPNFAKIAEHWTFQKDTMVKPILFIGQEDKKFCFLKKTTSEQLFFYTGIVVSMLQI